MSTRTFRVGLTGGIASGKSTAARFFGGLGIPVIDTKQFARSNGKVAPPPLKRLVERFGPSILTPCGRLDAPVLRNIVCSQPRARIDLEALTHPLLSAEMEAHCSKTGGPYQVFVIPLLVEQSLGPHLDRVVVVDCDEEVQIRRLQMRDGSTLEQARALVSAQTSRSARLRATHDLITNNADMSAIRDQVAALHLRYLALAK